MVAASLRRHPRLLIEMLILADEKVRMSISRDQAEHYFAHGCAMTKALVLLNQPDELDALTNAEPDED